jgi:hypothetical protein
MPVSSQEYNMFHEVQEFIIEDNEVYEGEDNDENCEDDLYIPPSNFESIIRDPYLVTFFHELCENRGYNSPVSSFQRTCYFNGTNSFAVNINRFIKFIIIGGAEIQNNRLLLLLLFFKKKTIYYFLL